MSHLRDGVSHFNSHQFWEAHESWEHLWLADRSAEREFLQGLIQLAAAYYHVRRGNARGAVRLFDAALRRLEPFPARFRDIDREAAVVTARRHREIVAGGGSVPDHEFPRLSIT
ncbi:MAG TPA: DUF309 domain-containing protein [Thermoanaerobaculia bacterium]|jgi:predicted metal-dependent hydrolase